MENEAHGEPTSKLDEFHELLKDHEREVRLGNVPSEEHRRAPVTRRRRWFRPLMLFIATCLSTYYVGLPDHQAALIYSASLMSILVFHEMGHFLQSLRYRVPASFPYFIPMPVPPVGTMGAVIVQQPGKGDRKALFDIAISGPLAGLVLALPLSYFGLKWSEPDLIYLNQGEIVLQNPLIFQWLTQHFHGDIPPGFYLKLHPMAHAGWVGIFITALNLVPVSQLDGGHIMYTLILKRAYLVAVGFLATVLGYMLWTGNYQWILMVALVSIIGPFHPPTADDQVSLGRGRTVLGWLTLAFFIIGITPDPLGYYN